MHYLSGIGYQFVSCLVHAHPRHVNAQPHGQIFNSSFNPSLQCLLEPVMLSIAYRYSAGS